MKLKLYTADGSSFSEVEIKNFPKIEGDKGSLALKQYLIAYQANQRQGNASTMSRNQKLSRSGKKIYAQKGTGRSRHGDKTAPQMKGGGVAFGPHPRKYTQKLNEKSKKLAFARALNEKANSGAIVLIEKFDLKTPKTKLLNGVLTKISPKGKLLIVDDTFSAPALLSARNIARIEVSQASQLNAYDIIRYPSILVSQKGLEKIIERAS